MDEATRLFNRDGWQSVSVRDISRSLEISPGNLSYHFPRKSDLIKAILMGLWTRENKRYEAFSEGRASIGSLLSIFQSVFREQLDNHGCLSIRYLFYEELIDINGRRIEQAKEIIFKDILNELVAHGELTASEEDVSFLLSFLLLLTRSWITDHSLDNEADIQKYIYLLAQQLYYFATEKGIRSIDDYLEIL